MHLTNRTINWVIGQSSRYLRTSYCDFFFRTGIPAQPRKSKIDHDSYIFSSVLSIL